MKKLIITQITNISEKKSKDNNEYLRVSALANEPETGEIHQVKISMTIKQWNELKEKLVIVLDEKNGDLIATKPPIIEFAENGFTNSQHPKPLAEYKSGFYNGKKYDYINLNVGVLIMNKLVSGNEFKKDLRKFI